MTREPRSWDLLSAIPWLWLLGGCFLLGMLVGCAWAGGVSGPADNALGSYVTEYLTAMQVGTLTAPGLFTIALATLRWPILISLLAFTATGVVGIPVIFAVRGFLLSFSVASFVRVLGGAGVVLAFALFGLTGLFSLPALFLLGWKGIGVSACVLSRLKGRHQSAAFCKRGRPLHCLLCWAVFSLCIAFEYAVLPSLLETLAGTF